MEQSLAHLSSKPMGLEGDKITWHMVGRYKDSRFRLGGGGWRTGRMDLERQLGKPNGVEFKFSILCYRLGLPEGILRKKKGRSHPQSPCVNFNFTFTVLSTHSPTPSAHLCPCCLPAWLFSIDSNPTHPFELSSAPVPCQNTSLTMSVP